MAVGKKVVKLLEDLALEASGLSSAKRLYDEDVKPMFRNKKRRFVKKPAMVRRVKPKAAIKTLARRKKIGDDPGIENAKRFTTFDTDPANLAIRTLYSRELTDIPHATVNNAIDERQRDLITISGFKIAFECANNLAAPLHLNVAVVCPKDGTVTEADFFRGTGDTRAIAFATTLSSLDFSTRHINADKYTVLYRRSFVLGPESHAVAAQGGYSQGNAIPNFLSHQFWVPLRRQLRYTNAGLNANDRVYYVWWCDNWLNPGGTAVQASAIAMAERVVTFFRETCSC